MADGDQPILFKTVKVQEDGHHGGAWKVAYADFVTAMMAFFLLLWLLNSTSEEQKQGISNYFKPTVGAEGGSGAGGLFGGISAAQEGFIPEPGEPQSSQRETPDSGTIDIAPEGTGAGDPVTTGAVGTVNREQEEALFNSFKRLLEQQLETLPPELRELKRSIVVEITEEGLRIQLLDNEDGESFLPGTADLTARARMALRLIAAYMDRLANPISVTGHTRLAPDAATRRTDWGLSLARANAGRRELVGNGIPARRFQTVVGKGGSELYVEGSPADPRNDRLSIVLLRQAEDRPGAGEATPPPTLAAPPILE